MALAVDLMPVHRHQLAGLARIVIAKTAVASEHVRHAFFHRAVSAVPIDIAPADRRHRAPGEHAGGPRRLDLEANGGKDRGRRKSATHHLRPPWLTMIITCLL